MKSRNYAAQLVIQNAGGVRIDLPKGDITIETAYTLLPFQNTLYLLTLTGAEIKQVLEESLSNHFDKKGSTGAFPYAAGIRYTIEAKYNILSAHYPS
ncbi:5'-nucleotidase/2',3'-cyclic phosphodiesterase [Beggiatoa sp. PS]|nr:5'-nucleotidase/2',3'-cyclic phosphodiesterase [Beggiatoa sp. PS]